jgi:hypothetical protein
MDTIIKITRVIEGIRIEIDTFTPLGEVWASEAVYTAILQSSMALADTIFILKDNSDNYYKSFIQSLENRIKSVKNLQPKLELKVDGDLYNPL